VPGVRGRPQCRKRAERRARLPLEPFEARIQQVRAHAQTLRALMEHDRPPAMEMADGELGAV